MKSQKARNRIVEGEIFRLVNKEREKRGLKELQPKTYLIRAARRHSRYMTKRHRFAHTTRKGYEPWDRVKKSAKEDKSLSGLISRIFGIHLTLCRRKYSYDAYWTG